MPKTKSVFETNPLPWRAGKEELHGTQILDTNGDIVGYLQTVDLARTVCEQMNKEFELVTTRRPAPTPQPSHDGLTKEGMQAQMSAMMRARLEASA